MKRDNSVYEITAPSLILVGTGVGILMLGNPPDSDKIQAMFERHNYESELFIFKDSDGINSNTIAWAKAAMNEADIMFVDLDTVNQYELTLALLAAKSDKPVLFLCRKPANRELAKLIPNFGIDVISSLEILANVIANLFSSDDE
jgi:hypothetical protein